MDKNRKILALVLVVCMALSLAPVTNAKYTDDYKIKYGTAVGVMTGIGAINGKPSGSFDPTGLVTRAEAAKLVTLAILGPALAKTLPQYPATFSDVPATHWAATYIGYLVLTGIVSGRGNGKFDPNGNVTAAELAKMMLCAAGYGKNNEYAGSFWENNVLTDAFSNAIFSAEIDINKPTTREEAALYVFNALMNVVKVLYSKTLNVYNRSTDANNDGITIAIAVYSMMTKKGIITGTTATGQKGMTLAVATIPTTGSNAGEITKLETSDVRYACTTAAKQIGTVVKIYYKDADTVYYMETLSKSVTSLLGSTASMLSYTTLFGSATAAPYAVNATANYKKVTVDTYVGFTADAFNSISKYPIGTYAIFGGNVVSYAAFSVSYIEKVTAMNATPGSESVTVTSGTVMSHNASSDVVNTYDGLAVGDTVSVTPAGSMFYIEKTSTAQGTISQYFSSTSTYILGGKNYVKSSAIDFLNTGFADMTIADYGVTKYTLYLDANGMVYGLERATSAASNVVYAVAKAYQSGSAYDTATWSVQAVDSTGAAVIYNVGNGTGTAGAINPSIATQAGFYRVVVDTQGKATFYAVATADLVQSSIASTVSKTDFENGAVGGNIYFYAPDIQFIYVSGLGSALKITKVTGVTAAAGSILKDITAADGTLHLNAMLYFDDSTSTNKSIITVIIPHEYERPSSTGTELLYLPSTDHYNSAIPVSSNADGYTYKAYIDGSAISIRADRSNMTGIAGKFVNYTVNADGLYTIGSVIDPSDAIVYGAKLDKNSIFKGIIALHSTAGAAVVDLFTDPEDCSSIKSVSDMEALTESKIFYVDYAVDAATSVITQIYITCIAEETITILTQPSDVTASVGASATLTAAAAVTNSGPLSYQWYSNTSKSNTGSGVAIISGATDASYAAPTTIAGTKYYICMVSSPNARTELSEPAAVTVIPTA
jgi:hypothetical protein